MIHIFASKESSLGVNAEKHKYKLMSCEQNVGQNPNTKDT